MRKILLSISLAAFVGILSNPFLVFAEEPQIDEYLLVINEEENLTDTERFEKAKAGLEKALSLALDKVNLLTAELDSREFDEAAREAELKTGFLQNLDEYRAYYSDTLDRVASLENLESVQTLAKEVKVYRDTVYSPGAEGIVEFILIFYSEDVIQTATERFEKITQDIEKLESLGLVEPGAFTEQMTSIESLLISASELRIQAKDMIILPDDASSTAVGAETEDLGEIELNIADSVPMDEPEEEVTEDGSTKTQETIDENTDEEKTPKNLLEESLNNVKSSYEVFLEISGAVREVLGLE